MLSPLSVFKRKSTLKANKQKKTKTPKQKPAAVFRKARNMDAYFVRYKNVFVFFSWPHIFLYEDCLQFCFILKQYLKSNLKNCYLVSS